MGASIGKSLVKNTLQLLGAAILVRDYLFEPVLSEGHSMLPTIASTGEVLIIDKLSPLLRNISVGDVVVCVSPEDPNKLICKRVLAMVAFI
jgi:inner membrane protease subunit 1